MQKKSELGLALSGTYLALYAIMTVWMFMILARDPAHSEFAALGLVMITFPWCAPVPLFTRLLARTWVDRFFQDPILSGVLTAIEFLPAAVPYTVLLYFIGKRLSRRRTPRGP